MKEGNTRVVVNSLLILQKFTTARKSGNIILKKKKKLSVCQNYVAAFSCCGKIVVNNGKKTCGMRWQISVKRLGNLADWGRCMT